MKIIARVSAREVVVQITAEELARVAGLKEGYISDDELAKQFCVGTTIGVQESFNDFRQVVNSPERLSQMADKLREEAERIKKMATTYARIITPPVKPARAT